MFIVAVGFLHGIPAGPARRSQSGHRPSAIVRETGPAVTTGAGGAGGLKLSFWKM